MLTEEWMYQRHIVIHIETVVPGPVVDKIPVVAAVLRVEVGQRPPVVVDPVVGAQRDIRFTHQGHANICLKVEQFLVSSLVRTRTSPERSKLTVHTMINVSLQMARRLVGVKVVVRKDGLSHHFETVQLVVHVDSTPVVLSQLAGLVAQPHRCAVDAAQIVGLDLDIAELDELVPSGIQLRARRAAEDVIF